MTKLLIFDPPQCCSTGVCGPDVDPVLVQFAADLKWLGAQGVAVERYNLGQQPETFAQNKQVLKIINEAGTDALPLIVSDGMVVSHTRYPSREELARMAGVTNGTASQAEEHAAAPQEESIKDEPDGAMLMMAFRVLNPEQVPSQDGGCCGGGEDSC